MSSQVSIVYIRELFSHRSSYGGAVVACASSCYPKFTSLNDYCRVLITGDAIYSYASYAYICSAVVTVYIFIYIFCDWIMVDGSLVAAIH